MLALLLMMGAAPLLAQDRLVRRFGGQGELVPPIVALAQDSVGFLWASTRAGLFRFDGTRFQRWAPDVLPIAVGSIAVSPAGDVVVVDADGRIVELTANGARELPGRARRSPDHTQIAAFDGDGRLWVVGMDGRINRRAQDGTWRPLPVDVLPDDTTRKVFSAGPRGGILVAGGDGLWHLTPESPPRRLLQGHLIVDALARPDGVVLALSVASDLIRIPPSGAPEVATRTPDYPVTRGISLAERDGTIWLGTDRFLIALNAAGAVEILDPQNGVIAGGPLLVDHEGSLWHGGFTALSQYPEPDTRVWNENHGLRSNHTRFLARSGDYLWITTWQGPTGLRRTADAWAGGVDVSWWAWGQFCTAGDGLLWTGARTGVIRLDPDGDTVVHPENFSFGVCAPASAGGFWIASGVGLHHLSANGETLRRLATPSLTLPDSAVTVVMEDSAGRLWVNSRERVCHAPAASVVSGLEVPWACEDLPAGTVHLTAMTELPGGHLWASSSTLGLLHRAADGWQPLADNSLLPTRSILNLVPSRRGGVWLVGAGILQRVQPRAGGAGWTVLEQLGAWQGLPSVGGGDLLEEEDGTIWIATSQGVVHVPARARTAQIRPPRMALVEGRVDGRPVPLDGDIVLPADRNRLELRFAALTFRDPGSVRYQVRLSPGDEWSDTDGQPLFTWVDLPAGRHQPQVRASADGLTWSMQPAGLAFSVLPPWYRTAWAMTGFLLLAGALLFGVYRARLAYLIGLERQRTRIAMDLHDEMGSGLASIGILAGVLSENGGDAVAGRRIAREVATTAEELGTSLSDIVWALDPHRATLEELAARLAEHGGRLFADDVRFDAHFPAAWPSGPLTLPLRRNVLLMGLEALHNAARHADAQHVVLGFRASDDGWILEVADDGKGLPAPHGNRGQGRGLRAMQRRAAEIGASISWDTRQGQGTTVRLRFRLTRRQPRFSFPGWLRRSVRPPSGRAGASHDHAGARQEPAVHR
ncbi:MAG TPA: ATP-binding protein [Longimicrobiales bacterium]|nr:ATP-binding protein [Longimicrobiales bacterium]